MTQRSLYPEPYNAFPPPYATQDAEAGSFARLDTLTPEPVTFCNRRTGQTSVYLAFADRRYVTYACDSACVKNAARLDAVGRGEEEVLESDIERFAAHAVRALIARTVPESVRVLRTSSVNIADFVEHARIVVQHDAHNARSLAIAICVAMSRAPGDHAIERCARELRAFRSAVFGTSDPRNDRESAIGIPSVRSARPALAAHSRPVPRDDSRGGAGAGPLAVNICVADWDNDREFMTSVEKLLLPTIENAKAFFKKDNGRALNVQFVPYPPPNGSDCDLVLFSHREGSRRSMSDLRTALVRVARAVSIGAARKDRVVRFAFLSVSRIFPSVLDSGDDGIIADSIRVSSHLKYVGYTYVSEPPYRTLDKDDVVKFQEQYGRALAKTFADLRA